MEQDEGQERQEQEKKHTAKEKRKVELGRTARISNEQAILTAKQGQRSVKHWDLGRLRYAELTMELITITLVGLFMTTTAFAETANFDNEKPGSLPHGWIAGVTGTGQPKWAIEADPTAPSTPNVLKQSGAGTFPWCVKNDVSLADGFLEVTFKSISGKEDQAGGLVWRWKDGDNYYVARANALENNVTIYHVIEGSRRQFKNVSEKVAPNQWHTLRADFQGHHFTVTFDGKKVIEADDGSITGAGAVGVWTKADSVTSFDEFSYGGK